MQKQSVHFDSAGSNIAAHLFLPESDVKNAPAILLCHGFAGVKELLLPAFAEHFAKAGFVAMTFDYRGFGESEGEAGRLTPRLQIEDIKNVISFLADREEVNADCIGLWGTSFGGANVVIAASEDARVKALSVQLTFADGERVITGAMGDAEKEKFLGMIERMQQKKENLAKVNSPLLIIAATNDGVNPVEESYALYQATSEPKELFVIDGATHYELYEGEHFLTAVTKQVEWFKCYLCH